LVTIIIVIIIIIAIIIIIIIIIVVVIIIIIINIQIIIIIMLRKIGRARYIAQAMLYSQAQCRNSSHLWNGASRATVSRAQTRAVMGRGFTAHFRSTPFFTLLALMKTPLKAKKNAAMVRLALEPRLMAAFTCIINVLLLLLLSITTSLHATVECC